MTATQAGDAAARGRDTRDPVVRDRLGPATRSASSCLRCRRTAWASARPRLPLASSTSLLPVTVTVDPSAAGVCSLSGATVTATALGTCSLTATQEGDDHTLAATPVHRSFEVVRAANTITFGALAGIEYGASQPVVASGLVGPAGDRGGRPVRRPACARWPVRPSPRSGSARAA